MDDRARLLGRVRGAVRGTPYEVEETAAGARVHAAAGAGRGAAAAVDVVLDERKGRAVLTSGTEVDGRPVRAGREPAGAGADGAEDLESRVAGAVEAAGWRAETRPGDAAFGFGSPLAVVAMLVLLFSLPLGVTLALML
ncbi:hypothetical protein [Nocardiopsis potens]|uniref:hypothetical protein n=1 Tax=Nocardiopsis potens TaxID=1246458 RepID=UPI0003487C0F|nr:hypothetical protein [Nocardiopsis potens]